MMNPILENSLDTDAQESPYIRLDMYEARLSIPEVPPLKRSNRSYSCIEIILTIAIVVNLLGLVYIFIRIFLG